MDSGAELVCEDHGSQRQNPVTGFLLCVQALGSWWVNWFTGVAGANPAPSHICDTSWL
jgi:hypothetical protein